VIIAPSYFATLSVDGAVVESAGDAFFDFDFFLCVVFFTVVLLASAPAVLGASDFIAGAAAVAGVAGVAFGASLVLAGAAGAAGVVPWAYAVAAKANAHRAVRSLLIEFFLKMLELTGIIRVDAINARIQSAVDTLAATPAMMPCDICAFWSRD
jgi:energy-converting hydrogenase Eha subunit H